MGLYSYKLTDDTGFAPNPFWGFLTLATCKPGIRQSRGPGDWIAGFTSATLNRDAVGAERVVFLMHVDEKLTIEEYFYDSRFLRKVPEIKSNTASLRVGDNIYRPSKRGAIKPGDFEQIENPHHYDGKSNCGPAESKARDVSGRFVLVSSRFVYFGRDALEFPSEYRPTIPYGMSPYGARTDDPTCANAFIEHVFGRARGRSIVGPPHTWPDDDISWVESR